MRFARPANAQPYHLHGVYYADEGKQRMPLDPSQNIEQPLLKTKISIPRIPPEFVHRSRLTERINRGVRGPLTLLSAPAGFGKTNLLVEWTAETSLSVAWLTLDGDDNDLVRFFRYLTSAFQTVEPRLGEEALDIIQTTKGSGLEMGLTYLINEISALPKDIALVLDEFQVIEDPSIYQSFSFLLKHLPQNLHLVIASRSQPALDLANLRAKRRVVELGADDLRFTADEVALFFKQAMDLDLPSETVRALEKRTHGWITALQMAAISLRHQADPISLLANLQGDAHYLVDFLAEEVLTSSRKRPASSYCAARSWMCSPARCARRWSTRKPSLATVRRCWTGWSTPTSSSLP